MEATSWVSKEARKVAKKAKEDSKGHAGYATSTAILPSVAHMVPKKAKAKAVDPRNETSKATPKAPI